MGPSTVPWGTPPLTGNQSEKTPLIFTRCFLPDRKSITQLVMGIHLCQVYASLILCAMMVASTDWSNLGM